MPEKITLFEPHFHDAQFGPTVNKGSEESTESTESVAHEETSTEDGSGGGVGKLKVLLTVAVLAAVGAAVYRKLTGDDSFEIEVEELETEAPATNE